jgi:hypothetical protein
MEGIGSLTIVAAANSHFDRAVTRAMSLPLYLAVAFSVSLGNSPISGSRPTDRIGGAIERCRPLSKRQPAAGTFAAGRASILKDCH